MGQSKIPIFDDSNSSIHCEIFSSHKIFKDREILIEENGLIHLLEGDIKVSSKNSTFYIHKNDTILLTKGRYFISNDEFKGTKIKTINVFYKSIRESMITDYLTELEILNNTENSSSNIVNLIHVIRQDELITLFYKTLLHIIEHPQLKQNANNIQFNSSLLHIKMRELLLIILTMAKHNDEILNILKTQISKSNDTIHHIVISNIFNNKSITELAEQCNMSTSTFKRHFVKLYHQTPMQWIYEKRFEKAKYLLKNSELSITDIALECGFESYLHFSRRFKTCFGISAKQFRSEMI